VSSFKPRRDLRANFYLSEQASFLAGRNVPIIKSITIFLLASSEKNPTERKSKKKTHAKKIL
jgi:hypothetical protein